MSIGNIDYIRVQTGVYSVIPIVLGPLPLLVIYFLNVLMVHLIQLLRLLLL